MSFFLCYLLLHYLHNSCMLFLFIQSFLKKCATSHCLGDDDLGHHANLYYPFPNLLLLLLCFYIICSCNYCNYCCLFSSVEVSENANIHKILMYFKLGFQVSSRHTQPFFFFFFCYRKLNHHLNISVSILKQ